MHVVTKILVVLAAMLSVLLGALTMAFSFNADRITAGYKDESALRRQLEADRAKALSDFTEQESALTAQISELRNQIQAGREKQAALEEANAKLESARRAAEVARDSIQQQIGQLGETVRAQNELIATYHKDVTQLWEAELNYRRREIELNDRINDLDAQLDVSEQDRRALSEQLAEMRLALERLRAGGSESESATGTIVDMGPPIRGRIVEVMTDRATGETLARVNIGSNDRVRDNMQLNVFREGASLDFLGHLIIIQTDLQWAIGRFDSLGQGKTLRADDSVISKLR